LQTPSKSTIELIKKFYSNFRIDFSMLSE